MNLSAHVHLNQPYDFKDSLGRTDYESTGLTCFCHQIVLTCLRNSGLPGKLLRFVRGLSTLCPLTESPSLVLVVSGQRVDNPVLIIA